MKRPTQRIYTNIETNQRFVMYYNDINDTRDLRNEITGEIVTNFYCAAFSGITLKFNDKSISTLNAGEFIELRSDKIPTHRKYTGLQKNFIKLKN
jgi:hypothetical protein